MAPREVLKKKEPRIVLGFDKDTVEYLSDKMYRIRLGEKAVARMIVEKGEKYVTECAQAYAPITRCFLHAMLDEGVTLPQHWITRTER